VIDLLKNVRREFNSGARERGDLIFWTPGAVKELEGNQYDADATVEGGQAYLVTAHRKRKRLDVSCECQYFNDRGPCKHLWAFLKAAGNSNLLGGENSDAPTSLQYWTDDEFDLTTVQPQPQVMWREVLKGVRNAPVPYRISQEAFWPERREVFFVLSASGFGFIVEILCRDLIAKKTAWGKPKPLQIDRDTAMNIPDTKLRDLLLSLTGVSEHLTYVNKIPQYFSLSGRSLSFYLERMCATGSCFARPERTTPFDGWMRLEWDGGPPWVLTFDMRKEGESWKFSGDLRRGEERMGLSEPVFLLEDGYLAARGKLSKLEHHGSLAWAKELQRVGGAIEVRDAEAAEFSFEAASGAHAPKLDWPQGLSVTVISEPPIPWLSLTARRGYRSGVVNGRLRFLYGDRVINWGQTQDSFSDFKARTVVQRDKQAEADAVSLLESLGLRQSPWYHAQDGQWDLDGEERIRNVVATLASKGWKMELEGLRYRAPSGFSAALSSGIDWFELEGELDFDGQKIALPRLLEALHSGLNVVDLGSGELGMIPPDLLKRYRLLGGIGHEQGGKLRFAKSQAGLLDVLLADKPEVSFDATFAEAREKLHGFAGIEASEQPEGFEGTLRGYQLEGLGWMKFLDEFGFGGCLADDMGVGKTSQVLAMLETRRVVGAKASLAVVPRSLVYNWKQEAARFTPRLRVLDHTSADRNKQEDFSGYDLVISTYGTLRKDAVDFRDVEFDYVILDEAQAIKNASSESAKAARLLKGRRRLVMTGTPIENHLGELWSLFEFLNPGMLGSAKAFKGSGALKNPDEETRKALAKALRPFLLRRTKEQVASELPPKQEQSIYCDLDSKQRELYNELRDFYRAKLLGKIGRDGLNKSKMQVLEALLRLRQAALHPALLGEQHAEAPSAKLDVMMEQLLEVLDEGHKALVFSQFTSFLSIVRERLDQDGIVYEYLDGQTRDRQVRVERFQNDEKCPVFLVSLKAGGVGLNLTAADYVFLLDPWWNPAVEAQAIDRTHRIGQTRSVFAYKLIARDTVEERVLELQNKKRDLAAAIVGEDNSLIRDLSADDLDKLLS
jgi:superfamily II DNA or RNA helicase